MSKVLIIGAGGVGRVTTIKCAQHPEVFSEILLASRTESKCKTIIEDAARRTGHSKLSTAQVDADNVPELVALMRKFKPVIVIHVALPYQDLTIMDACLACGVHYLDTANYEPKDEAKFEYSWQWAYQDRFKAAGLTAILGCGFDPGVTSVFTARAAKHHFDEMQYLETEPFEIFKKLNYPNIGERDSYVLYHEELESLVKNFPSFKRARFWMTFGQEYLTHLRVIQNIGMARIDAVDYKGTKVVPLEFLKYVLPDPGSLGENYTGETSIGCRIKGIKDGKEKTYYIWNNCSHQAAFDETGAQGVSYTTGVPAMTGAMLFLKGEWNQPGVLNVEEFNPDPFLEVLGKHGLPWQEEINIDLEV